MADLMCTVEGKSRKAILQVRSNFFFSACCLPGKKSLPSGNRFVPFAKLSLFRRHSFLITKASRNFLTKKKERNRELNEFEISRTRNEDLFRHDWKKIWPCPTTAVLSVSHGNFRGTSWLYLSRVCRNSCWLSTCLRNELRRRKEKFLSWFIKFTPCPFDKKWFCSKSVTIVREGVSNCSCLRVTY